MNLHPGPTQETRRGWVRDKIDIDPNFNLARLLWTALIPNEAIKGITTFSIMIDSNLCNRTNAVEELQGTNDYARSLGLALMRTSD